MLRFCILAILLISSLFIVADSARPQYNANPIDNNGTNDGNITTSQTGSVPNYVRGSMAAQFVAAHNAIRSDFHQKPLHWNGTLAKYARHWARRRIDDCRLQHSPDSPYGENMFWSAKSHWTPFDVVKCWGDEQKFYNASTNECINQSVCGHFTQIVWHNTQNLGCGRVTCHNNKGFLYVCSYDPPGNYYFEGPFGGHFTKSIVYPPPTSTTS